MKLLKFPIIQFTVYLIIGIFTAHHYEIASGTSLVLVCLASLVLATIYFIRTFSKSYVFSVLVAITFILGGILTYNLNDEKRWTKHYINTIKGSDSPKLIIFKISKRLKPTPYYHKYEAQMLKADSAYTNGTILLNIRKDSTYLNLAIGNVYKSYSALSTIKPPSNPNQFNYKAYLEKHHVYNQIYLNTDEIIPLKSGTMSICSYADRFRKRINKNLSKTNLNPDQLAIINALLLGQRQDISKDIYDNYVNAGAIHILAVSGLHVGIIMLLLQFLLKPLTYLKHGNYLRMGAIVFLLWAFAIIAGLSPSVTRAVTMFTIVAVALNHKRKTNIYNTLAISAFVLLLIKPMFLFHVGFQLSYIAVLAIVSFQPLFYKLIPKPKYWIPNKLWEIFTVTLAAQIGVLPLSLYYFHQFPGLFFVSNLVIIPFLGVILGLGLLIITLSFFNIIPDFIFDAFGWIISQLNTFIEWVAKQEEFLFTELPFGILQVLCVYIFIVMLYRLLQNFRFKTLSYALVSLLLVQGSFLYYNLNSKQSRFIVFNKNKQSLFGIQSNHSLKLFHNLDEDITSNYTISNYKIGNRISKIETDSLLPVVSFKNETILLIDSLGVYDVKSFRPDYVLLRNSPKVNLNRLIDSIQPKYIVADASNYKSYVQRWKATCNKKEIPFHSIYEKGAFIIE